MLKNKLLLVFLLLFGFANSRVLALTFDLAELVRIVETTDNEECLTLFKNQFLGKNFREFDRFARSQTSQTFLGDDGRFQKTRPLAKFVFQMAKKIIPIISKNNPRITTLSGRTFDLAEVAQYCRIITGKVLTILYKLDTEDIDVNVLGLDIYRTIEDEPQDDSEVVPTQTSAAGEQNIKRTFSGAFSRSDSGSSLSLSAISLTQSNSSEDDPSSLARTPSFSTLSRQSSITYKPKNPKKAKIDRAPKKSGQNAWDKRRTAAETAGKTFYDKDSVANFAAFFSPGK